jgi:hypothetical protein
MIAWSAQRLAPGVYAVRWSDVDGQLGDGLLVDEELAPADWSAVADVLIRVAVPPAPPGGTG